MVPFTEIGHIGWKSGWTSGGIGKLESSYDHANFEMPPKHWSEDIWYAVGFMNVEIKGQVNNKAIDCS